MSFTQDQTVQAQDHAVEYETPTWIAIIKTLLFLLFLLLAMAGASQALRLIGFHDTSIGLALFTLIYGKLLHDVFSAGFAAGVGFEVRFVSTAKKFALCTITGNCLPLVFGLITHPMRTLDHLYFDAYQVAVLVVGFPLLVLMFSLFICGVAQLLYLIHSALFLCVDKVKKVTQLP